MESSSPPIIKEKQKQRDTIIKPSPISMARHWLVRVIFSVNLFLGKLWKTQPTVESTRPENVVPETEKNAKHCIGHWAGLLEHETAPCFVCLELCTYIYIYILLYFYAVYKCMMIYSIYVWKKIAFMHSGLHIQPPWRFCMFFFACLGSKLFDILEQNSNPKSNCKQTQMATTKVKSNQDWKNGKNRMAFFNGFEVFFGDQKSHQPGNKKCVAPASSTKFDWSGRAPASLQIVFPGTWPEDGKNSVLLIQSGSLRSL